MATRTFICHKELQPRAASRFQRIAAHCLVPLHSDFDRLPDFLFPLVFCAGKSAFVKGYPTRWTPAEHGPIDESGRQASSASDKARGRKPRGSRCCLGYGDLIIVRGGNWLPDLRRGPVWRRCGW